MLALVLLLASMAAPSFRSVTGIQARTEVGRLAADIRATRGHAAVSGLSCRMVFCLSECWMGDEASREEAAGMAEDDEGGEAAPRRGTDDSGYWTECTRGQAPMERERLRDGRMVTADNDEEDDFYGSEEAEAFRKQLKEKTRFGGEDVPLKPRRLEGVQLATVWTGHQEEAYAKGRAYLYFRPSGITEHARIVLEAGDDDYTIEVSPLSGRVKVRTGRDERPPKDEEDN